MITVGQAVNKMALQSLQRSAACLSYDFIHIKADWFPFTIAVFP